MVAFEGEEGEEASWWQQDCSSKKKVVRGPGEMSFRRGFE